MDDDHVRLIDFVKDPEEDNAMESWDGVEGLIKDGVEDRFGEGASAFLLEAYERQKVMKSEIPRRYGVKLDH
jgi:hypothetical protein